MRGGELLVDPLAAEVAAAVGAIGVGEEPGLDQPVRLGLEGADLLLAAGDQRERGRLHAAERDGAVEGGAQADRRRAGGVHAHDPVGLRPRARGVLEAVHLLAGPQAGERLLDRPARHRAEPQPLDRLLDPRGLVRVGEDQLALAPGVAGVHDPLDVLAPYELVDGLQLLARLLVVRDELELLRQDRQVGEAPLLELRVVLVRRREADEVPDRPGDDIVVALKVGLVLAVLEGTGQHGREVAAHGWLLCDDERLAHESKAHGSACCRPLALTVRQPAARLG